MSRTAASGEEVDFGQQHGPVDVTKADGWGPERSLRAEVICDLLQGSLDGYRLTTKRLRITGAKIVGKLDFEDAKLEHVLVIRDCRLEEAPLLERASLPHLDLSGCRLPGLRANALSVQHDVVLAKVVSDGEVAMESVEIGGSLDCAGARFINAHGVALALRGGSVKKAVLFGQPFTARGLINLRWAHVGVLVFNRADLANASGLALDATGVKVDGNVAFLDACKSSGEVRLRGAHIGASAEYQRATLLNPRGTALSLERVTVDGPVFLRHGFRALGEVNLHSAQINGSLDCDGGTFISTGECALRGEMLKVKGSVFFRYGFRAHGQVSLAGAQIDGGLYGDGGRMVNSTGYALYAEGATFGGPVLLRWGFAHGGVNLFASKIALGLECNGGIFTGIGRPALRAERMIVNSAIFLRAGFKALGEVKLTGSRIGGPLDCYAATLSNARDVAFNGISMVVDGPFIWRDHPEPPHGIVLLIDARVTTLEDDPTSWPEKGKLFIRGFTYSALGERAPRTASARISWLELSGPDNFSPQPYEQLARVFRQSGDEREARAVAIRQQVNLRRWGDLAPSARAGNWILGLIGHGYRPGFAAILLLVLYLATAGVYHKARTDGIIIASKQEQQSTTTTTSASTGAAKPTQPPLNAKNPCPPRYPCFSEWGYAFDVLVPLVRLQQADNWRPDTSRRQGRWYRAYGNVMTVVGWALATLAVAGFSGLLRKT